MNHIHVCLVSEQTIPNILSIYHFKPERIIFCSTERMEKEYRTDAIINTLKLYGLDYSSKHEKVIVNQDCLEDCEKKFSEEIVHKYKNRDLLVNLTGGTKIMVIAAYDVFKDVASQMIYTPIPKNEFLIIYPRVEECKSPVPLDLRLSVEAYVTAYGGKVENKNKIENLKTNAKSMEEMCKWMIDNYLEIENLLAKFYEKLGKHRDDKTFKIEMDCGLLKYEEKKFLEKLGISDSKFNKIFLKENIRFLTGDWLSYFCFNEISKLSVDDCVTEIELISPKGTKNQFDVLFTKNNALYIVECKSLRQSHDKDADILYKISALQHDFGLRVKGFLVSTARNIISKNGDVKDNILKRASHCRSEVIHPDKIRNFSQWIKNNIKDL